MKHNLQNKIWVYFGRFQFGKVRQAGEKSRERVLFNELVPAAVFVSIQGKKKTKLAQLIDAEAYR